MSSPCCCIGRPKKLRERPIPAISFGLNSYSTVWVTGDPIPSAAGGTVESMMDGWMGGNMVSTQQKADGTMIGNQGQCGWLCDGQSPRHSVGKTLFFFAATAARRLG